MWTTLGSPLAGNCETRAWFSGCLDLLSSLSCRIEPFLFASLQKFWNLNLVGQYFWAYRRWWMKGACPSHLSCHHKSRFGSFPTASLLWHIPRPLIKFWHVH